MNIPISKTEFKNQDLKILKEPLESGWVVQGPFVKKFEEKWSEFTGSKYSIATTSCTSALAISLAAKGIKPGDEVIVPAFTWISSANVVEHLNANVVFCDIDLQTFNIDVNKIEKLITPRTKAIIPVHLFGLSADMDAIIKIAKKNNLIIVEDAACGFNSKYKDIHVGNFGDTGCFSFHPRKAITTGEGGMITTNDSALAEKMRSLRDHGASISDFQRHHGNKPYLLPEFPFAGYNYRMTDIQASIGCTQMDRADYIGKSRRQIANIYNKTINGISWLKNPKKMNNYYHGFQSYVCLFEPEEISINNIQKINKMRNDFMDYLNTCGIATRPGTHAVHMLKYYKEKYKIRPSYFENSFIADQCSISFPLFPSLKDGELNYILNQIINYRF